LHSGRSLIGRKQVSERRAPKRIIASLSVEPLEERALLSGILTQAQSIQLDSTGSGMQVGDIEQPGEAELFRVMAPRTGQMIIQLAGIDVVPGLTLLVFDSTGAEIPTVSYGVDDLTQFSVSAGQTYLLQAVLPSGDADTGQFTLTFQIVPPPPADGFGSTFQDAHEISLDASGSGRQSGTVEAPGDVDMFRFVAPVTDRLIISVGVDDHERYSEAVNLDAFLTVFDSTHAQIAQSNSTVTVPFETL
jgi:hypothetical protein